MQIFQTFENQHGRNHHTADRSNERHPRMQGFVRIHFALTAVKAVQAAIILRLQLFGIKVRLIIDLGIVRHFGGVFDFFRFTQGFKKQAVLFFIDFLLQLDAFQRIAGPRVVIQNIFLDSWKQQIGNDATQNRGQNPRQGNLTQFIPLNQCNGIYAV